MPRYSPQNRSVQTSCVPSPNIELWATTIQVSNYIRVNIEQIVKGPALLADYHEQKLFETEHLIDVTARLRDMKAANALQLAAFWQPSLGARVHCTKTALFTVPDCRLPPYGIGSQLPFIFSWSPGTRAA